MKLYHGWSSFLGHTITLMQQKAPVSQKNCRCSLFSPFFGESFCSDERLCSSSVQARRFVPSSPLRHSHPRTTTHTHTQKKPPKLSDQHALIHGSDFTTGPRRDVHGSPLPTPRGALASALLGKTSPFRKQTIRRGAAHYASARL